MTDEMNSTLHDLCQHVMEEKPDFRAVMYDDGEHMFSFTYSQVQEVANWLCAELREMGAVNEVVALAVHPNGYIPALLLGVSQVPAAFYNIDLKCFRYVMEKKHIRFLIMDKSYNKDIFALLANDSQVLIEKTVYNTDLILVHISHPSRVKLSRQLAYVITTSGTTGHPKIVSVPNSCIIPNVTHLRSIFQLQPSDVVFMASPLTFDPSIVEIFMTLSSGATLLIVPNTIKMNPSKMADILTLRQVTVLQATPTLISRFGTSVIRERLLSSDTALRVLALGGEACPSTAVLRSWRGYNNKTCLFNLYGITEVSSWATWFEITDDYLMYEKRDIPLGNPLSGTLLQVRDNDGNIVTSGQGQIFIGGLGRRCYIDDEDYSQSSKTAIFRNAGDISEVHENGDLFYRGRVDSQLKRHGKRLNLAELEKVCLELPSVQSCFAVCEKESLYLFVTSCDDANTLEQQVQNHVRSKLPEQYHPTRVVCVESVPMTVHGKVDKVKLLEDLQKMEASSVCLFSDIEKLITRTWKDVLHLSCETIIDSSDNFIQFGGTSFTAVEFIETMKTSLSHSLPLLLDILLQESFENVKNYMKECLNSRLENTKQSLGGKSSSDRYYSPPHKKIKVKVAEKNKINRKNDIFMDLLKTRERVQTPCSTTLTSDSQSQVHNAGCTEISEVNSNCDIRAVSMKRGSNTILHCCKCNSDSDEQMEEKLGSGMRVKNCVSMQKIISPIIRDDKHAATELKQNIKIQEKWRLDTGKCVDASPLVVCRDEEYIVYIGSHSHKFFAISLSSGVVKWQQCLGDRIESSACLSKCCTYVVVGCYDGMVYIFNALSGEKWWTYQTKSQVKCSPCVDLDTGYVYIGSHDRHLYALDLKRKHCVWKKNLDSGSVFSSPCVSYHPHQLYVATLAGLITALNPRTGDELWQYHCHSPVFSSPCCTTDGLCVASVDGLIHCISFSGCKLWTFKTEKSVFSSPCTFKLEMTQFFSEFVVIGSHDQNIYCLRKDGTLLWKKQMCSPVYSSPCVLSYSQKSKETQHLEDKTSPQHLHIHQLQTNSPALRVEYTSPTVDTTNGNSFHKNLGEGIIQTKIIQDDEISARHPDSDKNFAMDQSDDAAIKMLTYSTILGSDINQESVTTAENIRHVSDINGSSIYDSLVTKERRQFIVCCSSHGVVYLLNPWDGEIVAEWTLPGEIFSSPVTVNSKIIVGCRNNDVFCAAVSENSLQSDR